MSEKVRILFKEAEAILDKASQQLSEEDYMELCENVESSAEARYEAMAEQLKNKE